MKTVQRGSGWSIKLAYNIHNIFGYKAIFLLLYPITFFYFLVAKNVKESLKDYYAHIGKEFNNKVYFKHLHIFAICLLDRFISRKDPKTYKYTDNSFVDYVPVLNDGCMLVFSHYGGWGAMQNNATINNKVNVVMHEVMLESIKSIENSIEEKANNINVIDLSQGMIAVSVAIANAISKNEVISMMGDRATNDKYKLYANFFGKKAAFNKNPFQIAFRNKLPIIATFVIYIKMKEYSVKGIRIDFDYNLKEKEAMQKALEEYVKFYEEILKEHPEQWFNFYNFWEE